MQSCNRGTLKLTSVVQETKQCQHIESHSSTATLVGCRTPSYGLDEFTDGKSQSRLYVCNTSGWSGLKGKAIVVAQGWSHLRYDRFNPNRLRRSRNSQLVTTLQTFWQQGWSSKGNDQFFFLTSAQSPAMCTTQQQARGLATAIIPSGQALNTSHSLHHAVLYRAQWSILSLQPPHQWHAHHLFLIGQSLPLYIYIFEEAPNILQSTPLYSGEPTPLPSRTRGACTKLNGKIAMQMCQKYKWPFWFILW